MDVSEDAPAQSEEPDGQPVKDTGEVSTENRFDLASLVKWLQALDQGLSGVPRVSQFSGGASNITYLLRYPDRDLVLRRPPPGTKAASAHDMAREFRIQQALEPVFPRVPKMVGLCPGEEVIGTPFYVMERVQGTILRGQAPREMNLDAQLARSICQAAVDALTELHRISVKEAGLSDLSKGTGYVARQVEGWSARFRDARTWNVPSFSKTMAWLAVHQPEDLASCVIHGDFRLDNLVLAHEDPRRIVAILDWEMATIGDPLMDLGSAMAYWIQASDDRFMQMLRRQPTHLPGMLTRAQFVKRYSQSSGRPIENWAFYEVFGLFRLAVIIQQIYRRYHARETHNKAVRHYWLAVRYLNRRCLRLIDAHEKGRPATAGASL